MRRVLDFLASALLAALATLAVCLLWLLPKREEQARAEARALAERLKQRAAEAKAARTAKVEQEVAAVEAQAEATKAEDSVDVANRFIRGK